MAKFAWINAAGLCRSCSNVYTPPKKKGAPGNNWDGTYTSSCLWPHSSCCLRQTSCTWLLPCCSLQQNADATTEEVATAESEAEVAEAGQPRRLPLLIQHPRRKLQLPSSTSEADELNT